MGEQDQLSDFLGLLDSWSFGYTKVFCKYFVFKDGDQKHLVYGQVLFANEDLKSYKNTRIETEHIIAGQQVFDFTKEYHNKIVSGLKTDPHFLYLADDCFSLLKKSNMQPSFYYNQMDHSDISVVKEGARFRNPYLMVSCSGDRPNFPNSYVLDLEVRLLDEPYENLQELLFSLKLPQELINSARIPHIDFIATKPILSTDARLSDRKNLSIKFTFPAQLKSKDFSVGVSLLKSDEIESRFKLNGEDFEWSQDDTLTIATIKKEYEHVELVKLFPSYQGRNIGAITVLDPHIILNPRFEVHDAFYEGLALEKFLSSGDAPEFEYAVSALLHYLGLSSHRYSGVKKLTEGPDIIAFSASGHIYVVECTTGTPDHRGKLHNLHLRTESLKKHYREKGYNSDLLRPVLFTNLPKENTSADRATAANYKISLMTKEDLFGFLNRINNPPSDSDLYQATLHAIPSVENDNRSRMTGTY